MVDTSRVLLKNPSQTKVVERSDSKIANPLDRFVAQQQIISWSHQNILVRIVSRAIEINSNVDLPIATIVTRDNQLRRR